MSCRKNRIAETPITSELIDSPTVDVNCNFPESQSQFGYSFYEVGNQYYNPISSGNGIYTKFFNSNTNMEGIALINDSNKVQIISNRKAASKISCSTTGLLWTDYLTRETKLYSFFNNSDAVFENSPNREISNLCFNRNGTKFMYMCKMRDDITKTLLIIRDISFNELDSFRVNDFVPEAWYNLVWINDDVIAMSFYNPVEETIGIHYLNIKTKKLLTPYVTPFTAQKFAITSVLWSSINQSLYFCDGFAISKIPYPGSARTISFNSCDTLTLLSLSSSAGTKAFAEIVTRKKKSEIRIEEKHSIYTIDFVSKKISPYLD
ncbi:MAG: hypothetical protein CFE21_15125 [Bacteroidetes bacterium B1(2017)]|nr:MAG: hypothetical protein CFE21_15125 [Bacteroidetes bacterium B1(2017)]